MKKRVLRIEFESAFHHGSGFGLAGIVDRTVLRDTGGVPYLAGSAIKGKFRHAVLRILLAEGKGGKKACRYGDVAGVCLDEPCAVCLMFGSPYRQGRLRFTDAYPEGAIRTALEGVHRATQGAVFRPDSTVRANTAMDRARGTAKEHLLFTTETLPPVIQFSCEIAGELEEEGERLLKEAAMLLTHFGADSSRGLGRAAYKWVEAA